LRDFLIEDHSRLDNVEASSWRSEYQRLVDHTPEICTEVLDAHTNEVLHVSFCQSGDKFVTCSKDGSFIVWRDRDEVITMEHREDMTRHNWLYTWASRYNQSSSLLLVSGVIDEVDGILAVFEVTGTGEYKLKVMVENNPYDVMGCWVTQDTWLAGNMSTIISPDGHFFTMEAKLNLCHLPDDDDDDHDTFDDDELCQDTVLRYRHPTADGSNYLRCLVVQPCGSFSGAQAKAKVLSSEEQTPSDQAVSALSASSDLVLIFLCSNLSTTPHQLGFHRLRAADLASVPTISEPQEVLDMEGHIVGIALDPSGRYLHVNVRRWPQGAAPVADSSLPIAEDIQMRVLDLQEKRFLDVTYTGHKGFTSSAGAFYIYLDTSESLVASGGEDHTASIWDRGLGCRVARNKHEDVVNCVAFNPRDPETMVTVGDDFKVKVWISRRKRRQLSQPKITEIGTMQ